MNNQHLILAAVAAALAVGCAGMVLAVSTPKNQKTDPIFSREVIAYEILPADEGQEAVVKYEYQGEKLPEKLADDEVIEKRTEFSYTREIGIASEGEPIYEGIFYTRPTFVKDGNAWYYIEHATTTETAFNALRKENPIASLFWRKAYAATASPFSETGDGHVSAGSFSSCSGFFCCNLSTDWNTAHDATSGFADSTDNEGHVYVYATVFYESEFDSTFCDAGIYRTFLPFNTSTIPSGATISAATLNVYATSKLNEVNDGFDYVTVVRTSQGTHTTLANGDYDQCGAINSPTEGIDSGQRKDITSVSTGAYLIFTLNATGQGWIAKSGQSSNCSATAGISCFGLREGHDTTDNNPNSGANNVLFSMSEQTGTSQDPYLSVTYSGGDSAFWQFQDF